MVSDFFIRESLRLVITVVFTLINALIIREMAHFLKIDENFSTSSAASIWVGITVLIASYFGGIPFLSLFIVVAGYLFIGVVLKIYYKLNIIETFIFWLIWLITNVIMVLIVLWILHIAA